MGITLSRAPANPLRPGISLCFRAAVPSDLRNNVPVLEFNTDRQDKIGFIMGLDHSLQATKIR